MKYVYKESPMKCSHNNIYGTSNSFMRQLSNTSVEVKLEDSVWEEKPDIVIKAPENIKSWKTWRVKKQVDVPVVSYGNVLTRNDLKFQLSGTMKNEKRLIGKSNMKLKREIHSMKS